MFTRARRFRAGFAAGIAVAAMVGLSACAPKTPTPPAPTIATGARINLDYSGIHWYGADNRARGHVAYTDSERNVVALLTSALGEPASEHTDKERGIAPTTRFVWKGLVLETSRQSGSEAIVIVDAARVDGVRVLAFGKYSPGDAFPVAGSREFCSVRAYPDTIAGYFEALNAKPLPRFNSFGGANLKPHITIVESSRHRGAIGSFEASRAFGDPC